MHDYYGGRNTYGEAIGIVMPNEAKVRPLGDVGNAATFSFPVRYHVVKEPADCKQRTDDRSILEPILSAVRELEQAGVLGVAIACGFGSSLQQGVSAAVSIPVFTSSLLLLPFVYEMCPRGRKIGIITADTTVARLELFRPAGAEHVPIALAGMQDQPGYRGWTSETVPELDFDQVAAESTGVAKRLVAENPDVKVILLECVNLTPYAPAIRSATGLPVFDFVSLVNMVYDAVQAKAYPLVDLRWGKAWWRTRL